MLWGEVVCLDPLEWVHAGPTIKPGIFVVGQPGAGKPTTPDRRPGTAGLFLIGLTTSPTGAASPSEGSGARWRADRPIFRYAAMVVIHSHLARPGFVAHDHLPAASASEVDVALRPAL